MTVFLTQKSVEGSLDAYAQKARVYRLAAIMPLRFSPIVLCVGSVVSFCIEDDKDQLLELLPAQMGRFCQEARVANLH